MPPPPRLLSIDEEKLLVAPDLEPVKKFVAAALVQRKKNPGDVHYRHIVVQLRKRDGTL